MYVCISSKCQDLQNEETPTLRGKSVRDLSRDCENQERMVCKFKP